MRAKILKGLTAAMIAAVVTTSVQASEVPNVKTVTTLGIKKGSAGTTGGYLNFGVIDKRINLVYGGSLNYDQLDKDTSVGLAKTTVGMIIDSNYYLRAGIGALNSRYVTNSDKNSKISAAGVAGINIMGIADLSVYVKNSDNYGVDGNILLYSKSTKFGVLGFKAYADTDTINKELYNRFGGAIELSF